MKDIDRLLADLFGGKTLSEEEHALLEQWIDETGKNKRFAEEIQVLKTQGKDLRKRQATEAAFLQAEQQVERKRRRLKVMRRVSVAAGFLLLIGCGYLLFLQEPRVDTPPYAGHLSPGKPKAELILPGGERFLLTPEEEQTGLPDTLQGVRMQNNTLIYHDTIEHSQLNYHTVRVPPGGEYNVHLSDNTMVYINAGSTLRYPVRFTGNQREVYLTGEAYFEVSGDSLRPFTVHADDFSVCARGTSFNVNAYPDRNRIAATLVEGRVQAIWGNHVFDMEPGTQVLLDRETGVAEYQKVDVERYTSWKDGYYFFERMRLEEIMSVLSLWYNLEVHYQDPRLKEIEFGGRLRRYDSIAVFLELLEYTENVNYEIKGNVILFKEKTD